MFKSIQLSEKEALMQSNAASATEYRTQFVRAMSDVRPHRSNTSPEIKSKIRPEKETASSVERGGSHRERMQLALRNAT